MRTRAMGMNLLFTAVAAGALTTAAVAGEVGKWTYGVASAPGGELKPLAVKQTWKYFKGVGAGERMRPDAGVPFVLDPVCGGLTFQDGDPNMDTNTLGVAAVRWAPARETCVCPGNGQWAGAAFVAPRTAVYDVRVKLGNAALVASSVSVRLFVNGNEKESLDWVRRRGTETKDLQGGHFMLRGGEKVAVYIGEGAEKDEGPTGDATWLRLSATETDEPAVPPLFAFKPGEVTVGGEIGHRLQVSMEKILHHTDIEGTFARHFKVRKEKPDEAGGFAGYGMLLDGLVKGAARGIGGAESVAFKTKLLKELAAAQTSDGQLTMFLNKPGYWDNHENAYMIQAFVRDWLWFGEKSSLETAKKLADSLIARKSWVTLGTETAFNLLYGATREPRYLDYLKNTCFLEEPFEEYDAKLQVNGVEHVYTWIARAIGQMEYADLMGYVKPADRVRFGAPAYEALRRAHGPYLSITGSITGTPRWAELWDASQIGLGNWGETCASAYLMRLCARMSEWDGGCGHYDLYERVMHNAFFSAQSEDGLKYRYFTPFNARSGWWNRDTYCCPNNFRRMVFEIPDAVFRRADDGLAVCLYTPAELKTKDITAKMETLYPEDGKVSLEVKMTPGVKSLCLRIPKWCPAALVTVDGIAKAARPGWFEVRRDFSKGVKVTLDMPMEVRLVRGSRAQEGRVAVMRGPCVFALEPELNGLKAGGDIDVWDIDATRPMTWIPEKHAVEVTLKLRQRKRTVKSVLLTRYFKERKVRTYFDPVAPCAACEDEIAPGHEAASPVKQY